MMVLRGFCLSLSAAALTLLAMHGALLPMDTSAPPSSIKNAALQASQSGTKESDIILFPNLCRASIRFLSVNTPERSFQFHLDGHGAVSVNGAQADAEIFFTLLDQIAHLPVTPAAAFPMENAQLLMHLEIHADDRRHTAYFYDSSDTGTVTHIICGTPDTPEYRQTEGWRVGTLVMTCEGTRIQDAHGNETPVSLML